MDAKKWTRKFSSPSISRSLPQYMMSYDSQVVVYTPSHLTQLERRDFLVFPKEFALLPMEGKDLEHTKWHTGLEVNLLTYQPSTYWPTKVANRHTLEQTFESFEKRKSKHSLSLQKWFSFQKFSFLKLFRFFTRCDFVQLLTPVCLGLWKRQVHYRKLMQNFRPRGMRGEGISSSLALYVCFPML